MTSSHTRLYQRAANNFEEEYVKTLEDRYCIKVPDHDTSMGGALEKMKAWKSDTGHSPAKSGTSASPNGKLSPSKIYPPNGTHFTYEKAKLKALVAQKKPALIKRGDTKEGVVGATQKLKIRKENLKKMAILNTVPKEND